MSNNFIEASSFGSCYFKNSVVTPSVKPSLHANLSESMVSKGLLHRVEKSVLEFCVVIERPSKNMARNW